MSNFTPYQLGRNSVWYELGAECPLTSETERKEWFAGRRSALAEERLDADTEWD